MSTCSIQNLLVDLVWQQTQKTVSSLNSFEELWSRYWFIWVPLRHFTSVSMETNTYQYVKTVPFRNKMTLLVTCCHHWKLFVNVYTCNSLTRDYFIASMENCKEHRVGSTTINLPGGLKFGQGWKRKVVPFCCCQDFHPLLWDSSGYEHLHEFSRCFHPTNAPRAGGRVLFELSTKVRLQFEPLSYKLQFAQTGSVQCPFYCACVGFSFSLFFLKNFIVTVRHNTEWK